MVHQGWKPVVHTLRNLSSFPACRLDWESHQVYQNLYADLPTLNCLMQALGDVQNTSTFYNSKQTIITLGAAVLDTYAP